MKVDSDVLVILSVKCGSYFSLLETVMEINTRSSGLRRPNIWSMIISKIDEEYVEQNVRHMMNANLK